MMSDDLDKILNRQFGFKYGVISPQTQVRLLRLYPRHARLRNLQFNLETFQLSDLPSIQYSALSYTWGRATSIDDIREIVIDGQLFFVRRNLSDFLNTATGKGKSGLFFVDAICINQLDYTERVSQVREMARVYRNAAEVIAWLGHPDTQQDLDNVRSLGQERDCSDCTHWTKQQWAGFRYLSYHPYWTRVWIVQEVQLAKRIEVWCWYFTFPLSLFRNIPLNTLPWRRKLRFSAEGRPHIEVDAVSRARSPAERIVSDRTRLVLRETDDSLAQGTLVGTLDEMITELTRPHMTAETYQSQLPDSIHQLVRKFGMLECSDPRDKLYGFLGMLKESRRAQVDIDYTKEVGYAYRQALKIGLGEIGGDYWAEAHYWEPDVLYGTCLGYYCDARDAFGMGDDESMSILQEIITELCAETQFEGDLAEFERRHPLLWHQADLGTLLTFDKIMLYAARLKEEEELSRNPPERWRKILNKGPLRKLLSHR
ncbi:HET-domain-containing protein [Hypomontagnella submonticulosa]|nr:HET-domain-containing protein [Hypomontagnella submonticulosa]